MERKKLIKTLSGALGIPVRLVVLLSCVVDTEGVEFETPTAVTACLSVALFFISSLFFFFFAFSARRFLLRLSLLSSSESVETLSLLESVPLLLSVSLLSVLGDLLDFFRRFSSPCFSLDLCFLRFCLLEVCVLLVLCDDGRDSLSLRIFLCLFPDFFFFFSLVASESLVELKLLLVDRDLSPRLLFRELPLDLCLDEPVSMPD